MSTPQLSQLSASEHPTSRTMDTSEIDAGGTEYNTLSLHPVWNRSDCSDSNPDSPWSRKVILSLDGGGVRGYSSLLILKRLFYLIEQIETGCRKGYQVSGADVGSEEPNLLFYKEVHGSSDAYPWNKEYQYSKFPSDTIMDEHTDDDVSKSVEATFADGVTVSAYKPCHYFDYIAGTSTGGLSAIMLARMRLDIDKAIGNYDTVGNMVFAHPRRINNAFGYVNAIRSKYRGKDMEKALQTVIKAGLQDELRWSNSTERDVVFESDPARCKTVVVSHGPVNEEGVVCHEYLFRSYEHPRPSPFSELDQHDQHLNPGRAHREPIWKIGRATSAAPLYFPPISFGDRKFRDGGLVANNPASLAFSEVVQMHTQRPRLLISIGTCLPQQKKREKHSTFQISYIKNKVDTLSQLTKLLTQSEKTHRNLNLIVNQLEAPNKMEYSRFNAVTGAKEIDLDEWKTSNGSNQTLSQLRALTVDYLKQAGTHKELLKCARLLIMIRRQRASTVRWESYATNHLYYCPERKCTNIARALKTRESLRDHAYDAHGFIYDTLAYYGDKVHHACIWDQCEHGGVHLFGTRDAYLMHLEDVHNINKKAVFRDRQELERWLDRGRKRPEEALNFVKNYKERAKTMGHSPNHTGDGEVQNDRAELSRASEVEAR